MTSAPAPAREVGAEGAVHRLVRAQQHVIDLGAVAGVAQLLAEALEVRPVLAAEPLRVDQYAVAGTLQVAELRPFREREVDLLRRQDVEEQHLVAAVAEVAQGPQQRRYLVEAVRQDD